MAKIMREESGLRWGGKAAKYRVCYLVATTVGNWDSILWEKSGNDVEQASILNHQEMRDLGCLYTNYHQLLVRLFLGC